jgi:hypothetical protein
VNGVLVVDGGMLTGKTPGRALRGPGWEGSRTRAPRSTSKLGLRGSWILEPGA